MLGWPELKSDFFNKPSCLSSHVGMILSPATRCGQISQVALSPAHSSLEPGTWPARVWVSSEDLPQACLVRPHPDFLPGAEQDFFPSLFSRLHLEQCSVYKSCSENICILIFWSHHFSHQSDGQTEIQNTKPDWCLKSTPPPVQSGTCYPANTWSWQLLSFL